MLRDDCIAFSFGGSNASCKYNIGELSFTMIFKQSSSNGTLNNSGVSSGANVSYLDFVTNLKQNPSRTLPALPRRCLPLDWGM